MTNQGRVASGMAVLALSFVACHNRNHAQDVVMSCDSAAAVAGAEMDLQQLNGRFDVLFVANEGPKAGQSARGRLVLHAQDAGMVTVARDTNTTLQQPSIGQLDLALEDVGAVRMGDPMSDSNATPGVGLYVTRLRNGGVAGVIARVGSGANARGGPMMFDGGYFTLELKHVGTQGLGGTWRSAPGAGGPIVPDARGYFCAARIASPS